MLKEIRCLRIASRSIRSEMAEMIYRLKECEKEMTDILPCGNTSETNPDPPLCTTRNLRYPSRRTFRPRPTPPSEETRQEKNPQRRE